MINPKARPCDDLVIRSTTHAAPSPQQRKTWILITSVLGSSMAFIDSSVVNVALPKMEADLATTLSAMTWVINAYTLCTAALLLIGGAASDQIGRRRIFLLGIWVFAAASVGCGLAPNVETLILARAIQGVGGALLIPASLAIIGATFDEKERGSAIGVWSGASAIAAGGGPLLGGWLVDHGSWRAIFLINPVLAVVTVAIALRFLPESRDPDARRGLDWGSAALAFLGLGSLVYGLIAASDRGWQSPIVMGTLAVGVVLLVVFLLVQWKSAAPMMPLDVFHSLTFSGVNLLTLLLYGAMGGAMFFLPFLLIQVHGYSATEAGAAFLPFTIVLALLSRWGGGLIDRFGARLPLIIGPTIVAAGFVLVAVPGTSGTYWTTFLPPMLVFGLGFAVTVAPLTTTVLNAVPTHRTGVASGINNAVSEVASLLLIAVLGTVGISMLGHSLDQHVAANHAPADVRSIVDTARKGFVIPAMPPNASLPTQQAARAVIAASFEDTIRYVMLLAAGLSLASAVAAALMISTPSQATRQ